MTMKKQAYICPQTTIIRMVTQHMIAGSQTQSLGDATEHSEGGTLSGARGFSAWDSDED